MKDWDKLSSAELSDAVQRLYKRIEQYEIHLAELVEGTRERRVAQVQIDRLWKSDDTGIDCSRPAHCRTQKATLRRLVAMVPIIACEGPRNRALAHYKHAMSLR